MAKKTAQKKITFAPSTFRIDKFDPLDWWFLNKSNFLILSELAKKVFACQASSAESERTFSHAGRIKCSTRSQLSPHIVAAIVLIKSNADLLGKEESYFLDKADEEWDERAAEAFMNRNHNDVEKSGESSGESDEEESIEDVEGDFDLIEEEETHSDKMNKF